MHFRIAKTEFLRGLRRAQGIADRKSTLPMLANVLLRTQGNNQLLVAATDLNVSLTAELKSTNTSDGGIMLGAKNLYELRPRTASPSPATTRNSVRSARSSMSSTAASRSRSG